MKMVSKSTLEFKSKIRQNELFSLEVYGPSMLAASHHFSKVDLMSNLGWSRDDFLFAFSFWRNHFSHDEEEMNHLTELEQNFDKYLDQIIIKEIIE